MSSSEARPPGAPLRVKICGIRRAEDIPVLNELRPDDVGFVFAAASRRRIDLDTALRLRTLLDPGIRTVGVFVDQDVDDVAQALTSGAIAAAQLHGAEDAAYVARLRLLAPAGSVVIKAVRVVAAGDIVGAVPVRADWLLLDSGTGSGRTFDWGLVDGARRLARESSIGLPPFYLAGGLDPSSVAAAIEAVHPDGVDVSSGVETDGVKDPAKIRAFITAARSRYSRS